MSVFRIKTEFHKGESDCEVIVIAAGGLGEGAPPAGRYSHYEGHSFPSSFSSPHEPHFPLLLPQNELIREGR